MKVTKSFTFDAAHALTNYHGACERMHGHTYRLDVTVDGPLDQKTGMVVDFLLLKTVVHECVLSKLDHTCLNDVLQNPSAELLAVWVWEQLFDLQKHFSAVMQKTDFGRYVESGVSVTPSFPKDLHLVEVKIWETATSCVAYNG